MKCSDRRSRLQEKIRSARTRDFSSLKPMRAMPFGDDLTEAIYIDDEGVSEELKSEWQANDYLDRSRNLFPKRSCRMALCGTGKADISVEQPEQKEPSHSRLLSASRSAHGYRPLICTLKSRCPNGTPLTLLLTKCRRQAKRTLPQKYGGNQGTEGM